MAQHFVERALRATGGFLYKFGYGCTACVVVLAALPFVVTSAIQVILSLRAPRLIERFDPLMEIWTDHLLLVLDEPVILVSYRLNDLFGKFDSEILKQCQVSWYLYTVSHFYDYLDVFKGDEDEYALDALQYADLMRLCAYLSRVSETPEQIPEAISRVHDWMEAHPLLPDPERTEQE